MKLNSNLNDFVQKKIQINQLLDLAELLNLSCSTEIIPDPDFKICLKSGQEQWKAFQIISTQSV